MLQNLSLDLEYFIGTFRYFLKKKIVLYCDVAQYTKHKLLFEILNPK